MSDVTLDAQRMLILGAGPQLGAAIARRFAREGFGVTLVGRREQGLAALADQLRGTGVTVDTFAADAADPHRFREALDTLATRIAPGVVVYNAALVTLDNLLAADTDALQTSHAIDVLGAITAAQVFSPAMRAAGSGTFLATGGRPEPAYATLTLGKAGLRAAMTLLHDELKGDGVHAATITIDGAIATGTPFDPDRIADAYWAVHTQLIGDWIPETHVDGR